MLMVKQSLTTSEHAKDVTCSHRCENENKKNIQIGVTGCFRILLADSLLFCVSGFHRNEDMKAIDVLPILKEKVAFLSGQINAVAVYITDLISSLHS